MDIHEFVSHAQRLRESSRRSVLAIAGPPGAGKTTFAKALVDQLAAMPGGSKTVSLLPMDGYHLPNAALDKLGLRHVKGAPQTFDVKAYITLLKHIVQFADRTWYAPDFSRETDEPVPNGFCISPEVRLVVTEGNYLLLPGEWAPIKKLCAETWFLDVDPAIERARLLKRQLEEVGRSPEAAADWVDRSDLANAELVRAKSTKADRYIILPENKNRTH